MLMVTWAKFGTHEFVQAKALQGDGSLVAKVEFEFIPTSVQNSNDAGWIQTLCEKELLKSGCIKDFGTLLETGMDTDCLLVVGAERFKAHCLVLSARSEVFRAVFHWNTSSRNSTVVHRIVDSDPVAVSLGIGK